MVADPSARVRNAINYMMARFGHSITYYRDGEKEWSPTGYTTTWAETVTFNAIVFDAKERDIDRSGGRIQLSDKAFIFLASELSGDPDVGDEILYGGITYVVQTGGQDPELRAGGTIAIDITDTTYTVWARKTG